MENGQKPANPVTNNLYDPNSIGLTKREYFAGLAMQSILRYSMENEIPNVFTATASDAVDMADALLKALEQNQPQKAS